MRRLALLLIVVVVGLTLVGTAAPPQTNPGKPSCPLCLQ
jgi:hypothetical protein